MGTLFHYPVPPGVTKATAKQQMLKQLVCSNAPEEALRYHGFRVIAGVDEVGRGAIFGPVVAAAVVLPEKVGVLARMGLRDSKQLTREDRERLDSKVRSMAVAVGVAAVDPETIDRVNIYQATRMAMLTAVQQIEAAGVVLDHLILDAMQIDHPCAQTKLFYGDALCLSVAAASVVAKVFRDNLCCEFDLQFPHYGLANHKGYGTPEHHEALHKHGPTPLHRRSFAPVRALIANPNATLQLDFEATLDPTDPFFDDELLIANEAAEELGFVPAAALLEAGNPAC